MTTLTVKKFDSRFSSAVRFASRRALAQLLCTSTEDASGCSSAGRGYPNFTTAEGTKALQSLTTGAANTAVGSVFAL